MKKLFLSTIALLAISCDNRDKETTVTNDPIYTKTDVVGTWKITEKDVMGGYGWEPELNDRSITFKNENTFTSTLLTPGQNMSGSYSISSIGQITTTNNYPAGWGLTINLLEKTKGELRVFTATTYTWAKYKIVKN